MKSNEEKVSPSFIKNSAHLVVNEKGEAIKYTQEQLDEARRESAVGFAEWIESSGAKVYSPELGFWVTAHGTPTTSELYNLYLKNKEK